MADNNREILVLGGGFAGLFAALHMHRLGCDYSRTLIDMNWRFVFKPLLYELLTCEDNVEIIWPRYDELLSGRDVTFVMDRVAEVDLANRQITTESGLSYRYRYLVLALGSTAGYFGVPGAKEHTFVFRDGRDVIELSQHLRKKLQLAAQDETLRSQHTTVAIVGGGPSGIELATTLADLLPQWYEPHGGNVKDINIVVLQRGDEILSGMENDQLKKTAQKALKKRGVNLMLGATVKEVKPGEVIYQLEDSEPVPQTLQASTVVWTAGNAPNPVISNLNIGENNRAKGGKLKALPTLQLPDYPEVFAAGDCVANPGGAMPDTAQVAYQQGTGIADNIEALIKGETPQPVEVSLRGTLLKLGIGESAAEIFDKFEVKGHMGHLIREATYLSILPLPGYKVKTGVQWLTDEVFEQVTTLV